jgi:glyoxylase-like metal-dependent hydrolase (beta-lactamase superfamily II)
MLEIDIAKGIHRVEDSFVNWYLVEEDQRLTVVDTGVPPSWASLTHVLSTIGREPGDIDAIVLTHGHFDHIGFAERARTRYGVPVWVHENDVPLVNHPMQYAHERSRAPYLLHSEARKIIGSFLRVGAFWPKPIGEVERFTEGVLPVPGSPRIVYTPGHTLGHCALHLADRDVVISGDALVTLNPYTGGRGPQIVAGGATADSERALASLEALAETGARILLPGHGEPWRDGVERAAERARAAGAS